MTTLLRVDGSIRIDGSVSRALADSAEAAWKAEHPDGVVIRRDLGRRPIPAGVWQAVIADHWGWDTQDTEFALPADARAVAEELVNEFKAADAVLLAVPLYNYGIAQHVKTWIDLLLTDQGLLSGGDVAGRPIIVTLARGGGYGPGTPKEGWDHATPYLTRIFGDLMGMDVRRAEAELTLASVTPGMEPLIEQSKLSQEEAHSNAELHGTHVARQLISAAV